MRIEYQPTVPNSLNSSLSDIGTVRFNNETGYIQLKMNDTWVDYKYFDIKELSELIPTLTSNTSSSLGTASGYSPVSWSEPWMAFMHTTNFNINTQKTFYVMTSTSSYIQFTFNRHVKIKTITGYGLADSTRTETFVISGLLNGEWRTLIEHNVNCSPAGIAFSITLDDFEEVEAIKVNVVKGNSSIAKLQALGY